MSEEQVTKVEANNISEQSKVQEQQSQSAPNIQKDEQQNNQQEIIKNQQIQDGEAISVQAIQIDQDIQLQKLIEHNPEKSLELKQTATKYFKEQNYNDSIIYYEEAIQYTEDSTIRTILFSNIAICYIKNEQPRKAKKYCEKSLKYDQGNNKARMNLARCHEADEKYEQALEQYQKVMKNEKGSKISQGDEKFVKDKISVLEKKVNQMNQQKKQQVINGLKNVGNSILGYFGMSLDNFKMQKGDSGGYNIQFKQ